MKQDRWNKREADRQAEKAFREEHKGPGKFSGKYGLQPTQTELVLRMPWGCWLEYNYNQTLSEAWKATTEEFSDFEDWPSTVTVAHQIHSAQIIPRRKLRAEGLGSPARMDLSACFTWHNRADSASAAATLAVADAAISSTAFSDAAKPSTGVAAVSANVATAPSGVSASDPSPGAVWHLAEEANAPSAFYAEGPSIGAALASEVTALLPPSVSTANSPTCTTSVLAGAAATSSSAGAVGLSIDAATLAPKSAAAAPTGANTAALASNDAPAVPVTNTPACSKSLNFGGFTAGRLGTMMHDFV